MAMRLEDVVTGLGLIPQELVYKRVTFSDLRERIFTPNGTFTLAAPGGAPEAEEVAVTPSPVTKRGKG